MPVMARATTPALDSDLVSGHFVRRRLQRLVVAGGRAHGTVASVRPTSLPLLRILRRIQSSAKVATGTSIGVIIAFQSTDRAYRRLSFLAQNVMWDHREE